MFHVGQRVECIDGSFRPKERYWVRGLPVSGEIYTIESMEHGHRGLGLRLAELKNPSIPVSTKVGEIQFEPTFLASRFRAATDIGIFTKMLNSTSPKETVGA